MGSVKILQSGLGHVGVDLGRGEVRMPEHHLHGPQIRTVIDEVGAMVMHYVTRSSDEGRHQVVIVPQNETQVVEARAVVPEAEATFMRGGTVYSVGRFFSAKYADMVCETYVARGFFTTRIEL